MLGQRATRVINSLDQELNSKKGLDVLNVRTHFAMDSRVLNLSLLLKTRYAAALCSIFSEYHISTPSFHTGYSLFLLFFTGEF